MRCDPNSYQFLLLFAAPTHAADAPNGSPKTAIPEIARIEKIQIGCSTQEDLAREWGEGKTVIGGHPNCGQIWRIKGTSWRVSTDGFDYSERGLVVDQFSIGAYSDLPREWEQLSYFGWSLKYF